MRKLLTLLFFLGVVGLSLWGFEVRVLIGQGDGQIFLPGRGLIRVRDVGDGECIGTGKSLVYYQNRPYRGRICVFNQSGKRLVVNVLDIEDYVKGVLYNEISHYWPMEVLKAQAVVARTYALFQVLSGKSKREFDLKDDQSSQVYRGYNAERYRTNLAVEQTKGMVLICKDSGTVLPAFYHACCGGRTELPSEVWSGQFQCRFRSVEDRFCKLSPYWSWRFRISSRDFISALSRLGVWGQKLKYISISDRTGSGRVKSVLVITDTGQFVVSGKELRISLGPERLKSLLFEVEFKKDALTFVGRGWGHGVGMCQWGAYGMALEGYDYEDILRFYYPDAELSDVGVVLKSLSGE